MQVEPPSPRKWEERIRSGVLAPHQAQVSTAGAGEIPNDAQVGRGDIFIQTLQPTRHREHAGPGIDRSRFRQGHQRTLPWSGDGGPGAGGLGAEGGSAGIYGGKRGRRASARLCRHTVHPARPCVAVVSLMTRSGECSWALLGGRRRRVRWHLQFQRNSAEGAGEQSEVVESGGDPAAPPETLPQPLRVERRGSS